MVKALPRIPRTSQRPTCCSRGRAPSSPRETRCASGKDEIGSIIGVQAMMSNPSCVNAILRTWTRNVLHVANSQVLLLLAEMNGAVVRCHRDEPAVRRRGDIANPLQGARQWNQLSQDGID